MACGARSYVVDGVVAEMPFQTQTLKFVFISQEKEAQALRDGIKALVFVLKDIWKLFSYTDL